MLHRRPSEADMAFRISDNQICLDAKEREAIKRARECSQPADYFKSKTLQQQHEAQVIEWPEPKRDP